MLLYALWYGPTGQRALPSARQPSPNSDSTHIAQNSRKQIQPQTIVSSLFNDIAHNIMDLFRGERMINSDNFVDRLQNAIQSSDLNLPDKFIFDFQNECCNSQDNKYGSDKSKSKSRIKKD